MSDSLIRRHVVAAAAAAAADDDDDDDARQSVLMCARNTGNCQCRVPR